MELGWHTGAILDRLLAVLAWDQAPNRLNADEQHHLVVTSHDRDILNASLVKEPLVEVLRARVPDAPAGQRSYHSAGRNPRALRLSEVMVRGDVIALALAVHDRWEIPRDLRIKEPSRRPSAGQETAPYGQVARQALHPSRFFTAFDPRWRGESKAWPKLLKRHSSWIQGVYLRLDYTGRTHRRRSV